ncbi:MAG: DNA polymerase beta superfamily protein [Phycisphaerae bacterium]
MRIDTRLVSSVAIRPYPLLFVTISGAHLYGFPSADSDYDLRGVHVLPAEDMLGLHEPRETIEVKRRANAAETAAGLAGGTPTPLEIDLVTHDIKKFMLLMLRKNGYVLEQLYSPLVVHTTSEHEELKAVGKGCITRHHNHHYLGFARTQWDLFRKEDPPKVKPLLYVYRVLLTGIYLMRSGVFEANLPRLNTRDLCGGGDRSFPLPYIDDLIARKAEGGERGRLTAADLAFHEKEYLRLTAVLEQAGRESTLPDAPTSKDAMNDLLLRVRRKP